MKRLVPITLSISALTACLSVQADNFSGNYLFSQKSDSALFMLHLNCPNEQECTLSYNTTKKGKPSSAGVKQKLHVIPASQEQLANSAWSLAYVVNYASRKHEHTLEEDKLIIDQLHPMLSTNPKISKCWSLNESLNEKGDGAMLLCTISNPPHNLYPLYLFAASLSNCRGHEAFCGYHITPLSRSR